MNSNSRSNIVLVGFMASGKSRVGEMLAQRLGFDLIDIDATIERTVGLSINEIFKSKGEPYFRQVESSAVQNLLNQHRFVIVTGGGTPLSFENVQILKQIGQIFYLDANWSLILRRLKNSNSRPLGALKSQNDEEKTRQLYEFRRPIYANVGIAIDVNHENKEKTCNDIIERFDALNRLTTLRKTDIWDANKRYPIFHNRHAIDAVSDIILALGLKDYRPVIVTSDHLVETLKPIIKKICGKIGETPLVTFGDGEQHKKLASITHIHHQMFSLGLTRNSLVIALGGGNVGDVAGFASAIYLRGLPFIQIPATLLAMVDASIGGKTGIDLDIGKNLVGAFYNPKAVIIDPDLLATLPKEDFSCGMAEIIKHAIIADKNLFCELKNDEQPIETIIEKALKVKADIVFCDPDESNIRAHLNLGHTFAHAIEKVSNYQIKHGKAVAIGLVLATRLAKSLGLLEEDFISDLISLLKKFELPTELPDSIKKHDLIAAMKFDKKRDSQGLKFILPKRIGEVVVQHVDEKNIFERNIL